ncbi:WYL domain-containing protein [Zobellella sp. An-6]|uniref:WYL domain-containing protein n=1 Tax=Zobellella sp. An-6 TaxID=3400218 RepID=UPI004041034C
MNGVSTFFAFLSLFALLLIPVGLIRPRWLKLKTRVSGFFACLYAFAAFAGIGMLLDPETGPAEALVMLVGVGVWHMLVVGWCMAFRKVSDPKFQAAKNERINNVTDKVIAATNRSHAKFDRFVQNKIDDLQQKTETKKERRPASKFPSQETINSDKLAEFEESLTTIWAGSTKTIEFTYEKPFERGRSRRRVDVEELMYDAKGRIILRGHCHERGDERTFREDRILTKIKCGSKRYDFDEWCEELLGVDLYEVVPVR